MDRKQFSTVVADAYFAQYVNDDRVMNDPVVVFDSDTQKFYWQSSLTPLGENEVIVLVLDQGVFGEVTDGFEDMAEAEANLATWLAEENDDCWLGAVEKIQ